MDTTVPGSEARRISILPSAVTKSSTGVDDVILTIERSALAPEAVVAKLGVTETSARRIGETTWRIQCNPSQLPQLSVNVSIAPTVSVHIDCISERRLHLDLPLLDANEVKLVGVPMRNRWMCAFTPESADGTMQAVQRYPGVLAGARSAILVTRASMSVAAGKGFVRFPSPRGQKWTVFARCDGYAMQQDQFEHVTTPSVTEFCVTKDLPAIVVRGEMPAATKVLVFESSDPASVVRVLQLGSGRCVRIDRTNRNQEIRADTEYVVRCILPNGMMYRCEFTTDAVGQADVHVKTDNGYPPWGLAIQTGEVVDRIFVNVGDRWVPVPTDLASMSDAFGGWWRHDPDKPSGVMTWSGETWSIGIIVTKREQLATFAPGAKRLARVQWSKSSPATLDVDSVIRGEARLFEQPVYWEYSFAVSTRGALHWMIIKNGRTSIRQINAQKLLRYEGIPTRLRIRPASGSNTAKLLDITYALQ